MGAFKPGTRFTPQELLAVKQISTREVITNTDGFSFERAGREWHCKEHDSLVVYANGTGWKWYSQGISGSNAIDWLTQIHGATFQEAVAQLMGNPLNMNYAKVSVADVIEKPKELLLPPKKEGKCDNLYAYLMKSRMINFTVVDYCVKSKLIYQDDHNNVVFVGRDEQGIPRYASRRGTYTFPGAKPFKRDCLGSSKSYGFLMQGSVVEHVFVFEAPIDAISHAALTMEKAQGLGRKDYDTVWQRHTRLALGGVADNALKFYLCGKKVKEISFCLDNDEAGHKASTEYKAKYEQQGYKVNTYFVPEGYGKDYNEYLCKFISEKNKKLSCCKGAAQQIKR